MDFIKTKKELYQKSEDCPDGSIEKQRPTAQSGWPRNDVPRSAKVSVRLKSRPKSKTARPITHHDPGNCPRSATPQPPRHAAHDQRASREVTASRPRNLSRVPRPMLRPSRGTSRVRPKISSAKSIRSTTPADRESVRPRPFRLGTTVRPIVPTDRPNAAVDPKPVLKPISYFQARLNPKPPQKT
ncbi:unnamed protein product [Microthlaspi erraticum]|uniref:Uncharacterized protein n=1 Tax=Microthlaspi erraticum TaxID=1685480 RepID=A0A6D2K062_9BRAS|nr:unnamed protein product [Microthlaspi erraticum]